MYVSMNKNAVCSYSQYKWFVHVLNLENKEQTVISISFQHLVPVAKSCLVDGLEPVISDPSDHSFWWPGDALYTFIFAKLINTRDPVFYMRYISEKELPRQT